MNPLQRFFFTRVLAMVLLGTALVAGVGLANAASPAPLAAVAGSVAR